MTAPRLETQRLILRGFIDTDREPFAAMNADPLVMEHFPFTLSRAESDALVERIGQRWSEDGVGLWALERRDDGAFLGFTGLAVHRFEAPFTPAVEVGWRLAVEAWGFGYATEAAREALRFGFDERGLEEILSWTATSNVRSQAVMERLGMTHDPADDFDHPNVPVGSPLRRHVLYRLSRDRWSAEAQARP
ncbi:MAG TPA: GNAT family N-acetyltransferase [Candidatus Limnocylindrales bacterium]|nr:GNAT family N-acetyltransferase [Candidatus Limnocylindrales bacterium]